MKCLFIIIIFLPSVSIPEGGLKIDYYYYYYKMAAEWPSTRSRIVVVTTSLEGTSYIRLIQYHFQRRTVNFQTSYGTPYLIAWLWCSLGSGQKRLTSNFGLWLIIVIEKQHCSTYDWGHEDDILSTVAAISAM